MQEYVLIYAYDFIRNQVIFVEKDRPSWQKGRINLPGGKVEPGETPREAVIREFKEECGLTIGSRWDNEPQFLGRITGDWGLIHCFRVDLCNGEDSDIEIRPQEGETERFFWEFPESITRMDPRCMPNLRVVLPLLSTFSPKWTIVDNNPSLDHRPYTTQIELED